MLVPFQNIKYLFHKFDHQLSEYLSDIDPVINQTVLPMILEKGKRVRPTLVYLSAGICNAEFSLRCHQFAMVVELIHSASLFQDDVLDHAEIRRGRPSINRLLGNDTAVLVGDLLYMKAMALMSSRNKFIRDTVNQTVITMIEAEIFQGLNRFVILSETKYYDVIKGKTAALMSLSCWLGASLSKNKKWMSLLRQYGEKLGVAYQLIDDLLDWTGNYTNKGIYSDAKEGRFTLPALRLLDTMTSQEKKIFLDDLNKLSADMKMEKLQKYREMINERGIASRIREEAEQIVLQAADTLSDLPQSPFLTSLCELSRLLIKRGE